MPERSSPLTALIVEDNVDSATLFEDILSREGFDVRVSHHGTSAYNILMADPPHLLLLDLHLPGMPGDQVLRLLHDRLKAAGTCVIVASADGSASMPMFQLADYVMIKPLTLGQLRMLVRRNFPQTDKDNPHKDDDVA